MRTARQAQRARGYAVVHGGGGPVAPTLRLDFASGTIPAGVTIAGGLNGLTRNSGGMLVAQTDGIDHGASGSSPALSIRPDATNYILRSRATDASPWTSAGHAASGAPDGSKEPVPVANQPGFDGAPNVAKRIMFAAVVHNPANPNVDEELSARQQLVTGLTIGNRYCVSAIMRAPSGSPVVSFFVQENGGSYAVVGGASMAVTTSYARYSFTFVATSTSVYLSIGNYAKFGGVDRPGFTVDLDNMQLEDGWVATNNIFTTTTALTRSGYGVTIAVPSGIDRLKLTYDDGTVQFLACTPSANFTLPKLLNKTSARITGIVGSAAKTAPIASITYGTPLRYNAAGGRHMAADTLTPTWASDDAVYAGCCDTDRTVWDTGGSPGRNFMFNRLSTAGTDAVGMTVNSMDAFGTATQAGSENSYTSFKANSTIAVDDDIFMVTCRAEYGDWVAPSGRGWRQRQFGVQIIKSSDFGATFAPQPPSTANPYASPMFPTDLIGTMTFVQGGARAYRNESGPGMDQYVYVIAGKYWDDADSLIVGRVLRSELKLLDAAKFAWRQVDGSWIAGNGGIATAAPIIVSTGKLGQCAAQYIPALDRFVIIPWWYESYVNGDGTVRYSPSNVFDSTWDLYEGPNLWSLTKVAGGSKRWNAAQGQPGRGLYQAVFSPKTMAADGGLSSLIMTSGDFGDQDPATGAYTPTWVPLTLAI